MKLDMKKINDLYFERYLTTLNIIEKFHKIVESETYTEYLEQGDKIATVVLNDYLNNFPPNK